MPDTSYSAGYKNAKCIPHLLLHSMLDKQLSSPRKNHSSWVLTARPGRGAPPLLLPR
jgi:hypothetical protein